MTNEKFMELSAITESPLDYPMSPPLLHGAIGLATEAGELLDHIKRVKFYNARFDRTNVIEECGDALWYVAQVLRAINSDLDEAMEKNIAKLRARYPDQFTESRAQNRNLKKEREAMEGDGGRIRE